MFEIIVYKDGVELTRHSLTSGAVVLGRQEGNEIVLAADSVSRKHARLLLDGSRLFVEDLGSGNGTFIANQRIDSRCELAHGSEVQITPFLIRVEAAAAPDFSNAATAMVDMRALANMGAQQAIDPARTGARLILRRGEADKSSYVLTAQPITIGRSEDRNIILTDPASSRRHAVITFMGDHFMVKDEGSANGLVVNNEATREARLSHGDRLVIGETEFEVIWPGAPQRVDTMPSPLPQMGQMPAQPYGQPATPAYPPAPPPMPTYAPPPAYPAQPGYPPQAPAYPPQPTYGAGGIDPYSETGIMPAYDPRLGPASAMPGVPPGYPQASGYGVEFAAPVTKKRSPIVLASVAILVIIGILIGVKMATDKGGSTATIVAIQSDPCASFGETCSDPSDQTCISCLNRRARLSRGRELFAQKEFNQAVQEFQHILTDIDPQDQDAQHLRYISYEFWVLNAAESTLQDKSQTTAQKLEQMNKHLADGKALVDKWGNQSFTKSTAESTLNAARAGLGEAISHFNDILKIKIEDPAATPIKQEAEKLRSRALSQTSRLANIKKTNQEDAFVSGIQDTFNRAMAAKSEGSFGRASSLFKEVIDKDPSNKTGLADQARSELSSINRAKTEQAKPLYDEAVRLIRNEQWIEARKKLSQAVKIDPNFAEAQGRLEEVKGECRKRAESLYREARVQSNIQNYSQAEKLLRQGLQYVPDSDDPLNEKITRELKNIGKE